MCWQLCYIGWVDLLCSFFPSLHICSAVFMTTLNPVFVPWNLVTVYSIHGCSRWSLLLLNYLTGFRFWKGRCVYYFLDLGFYKMSYFLSLKIPVKMHTTPCIFPDFVSLVFRTKLSPAFVPCFLDLGFYEISYFLSFHCLIQLKQILGSMCETKHLWVIMWRCMPTKDWISPKLVKFAKTNLR